jgi:hypothetical protein
MPPPQQVLAEGALSRSTPFKGHLGPHPRGVGPHRLEPSVLRGLAMWSRAEEQGHAPRRGELLPAASGFGCSVLVLARALLRPQFEFAVREVRHGL